MIDYGLQGKVALVTGGSHGIGLAIAQELARHGCELIIMGRTERVTYAADEVPGKCTPIQFDVLQEWGEGVPGRLLDILATKGSGLDILINNVGGGGRWGKENVEDTSPRVWADVHRKNAGIASELTAHAIVHMKKKGWGRVVTISSIYGKEAGGRPWFVAAKAAEIAMMKAFSKDHKITEKGITFNSVCPGHILVEGTPLSTAQEYNHQKFAKEWGEKIPVGRIGVPQDVANVVAFLCSQHASYVNGSCITVDGGESHSF